MNLDEFAFEGLKLKVGQSHNPDPTDDTIPGKILPMRRQDFWVEVKRAWDEDTDDLQEALLKTFKLWVAALLYAEPLMLQMDQVILRELVTDPDFGQALQDSILGQE